MSEFETQVQDHIQDLGIDKVEELATRDHGIQPDTLKAEALVELSFAAATIAKEFIGKKTSVGKLTAKARRRVLESARDLVSWGAALLVLSNVEVMHHQDIQEYAKEFELELQHDAVLGCFTIQGAISDLGRLFYLDAHAQLDPLTGQELQEALDGETIEAEVIDAMSETLALACIISNLADCSFQDLLVNSFD